MDEYYSDREFGPRPPTTENVDDKLWGGLFALINMNLNDASFGHRFPESCPDSSIACGCDQRAFYLALEAEIPWLDSPLRLDQIPEVPVILDLMEFCAAAVGDPIQQGFHDYYRHYHLSWDREAGLERFVENVNLLFRRNGVAFKLNKKGKAQRILPEVIGKQIEWSRFFAGDAETDRLLNKAINLIHEPDIDSRRDALEKLWDAFERIKTLESGADKKASVRRLLDKCATEDSQLRSSLDDEAKALTAIGNSFRIRHSETNQEHIEEPETLDWLFSRMFGFLHLVLKATNRAT